MIVSQFDTPDLFVPMASAPDFEILYEALLSAIAFDQFAILLGQDCLELLLVLFAVCFAF